jgi:DNA-directed RNA polymerase subunit beta'
MHNTDETEIRGNLYTAVRIGLASPETIRSWSQGEVTRPETINFRTHRPARDGLFCERIFGPERDFECSCGKYRGIRFKGMQCDRCGVQVGHSRARRNRMGHIELASPVVHLWFFKLKPSVLAHLFGIKVRDIEKVVYYQSHIVVDPGDAPLARYQLLADEELRQARALYGEGFQAGMGAAAIRDMLAGLDLTQLTRDLRRELDELARGSSRSAERHKKLVQRLKIVQGLLDSGNNPAWMVLSCLPVIPPDLRPVVLLESGNYASSDLNDLYRRVLQRNLRLRKLLDCDAPEIILRNERRLLQQAVDALFDNDRCENPVLGASKRPLKSLAGLIHGKEGRFRQNLLGKRVDYSGRSVIVVGPELKLHQCGLPKVMALELYQPLVIGHLLRSGAATSISRARRMIQRRDETIWDALAEVMQGHPVLLNRAPTLHRMGIQAFEPILVEGHAIRLHPLVCKGFNADFDGDQMAVHLPLSVEARAEAWERMTPAQNVFSPANGQPIITPSKDMVLGCYYLTARTGAAEAGPVRTFASPAEVLLAHGQNKLGVHAPIRVRLPAERVVIGEQAPEAVRAGGRHRLVATTAGRVLFNEALPAGLPFYDLPLTSKNLSKIIADCQARAGREATLTLLERIKEIGFREATRSGLSFAAADLLTPAAKAELIARAEHEVEGLRRHTDNGDLTEEERLLRVIEVWKRTISAIQDRLASELAEDRRDGQPINPIHAMVQSGARGSVEQVRQLSGIRGLMTRPSGEVIETPITSSFREGLSSLEYFTSTHGARKGLVDTAMKTSDSGYLTRRLVDVAQNVVVMEEDCGTRAGVRKPARAERIVGRVSCETITDPVSDEVLVREDALITREMAQAVEKAQLPGVRVRSPLTCSARRGVCRRCYGMDRSTGELVERGLAVGVIAGQSIGEPGTQLTMRTFHIGGVASAQDITMSLPRIIELFEAREPAHPTVLAECDGVVRLGNPGERIKGQAVIFVRAGGGEVAHLVPDSARPIVENGDRVEKGQALSTGQPHPQDVLRLLGLEAVRAYLVDEVQAVYRKESVDLDDKHVEVIVSQMLGKVKVRHPGDSALLPDQVLDRAAVAQINARLERSVKVVKARSSSLAEGAVVERRAFEVECQRLRALGQEVPTAEPARRVEARVLLLGVTRAALHAESFLSAASFQETKTVLAEAALVGKVDPLCGLKENVLLGQLVPAGTGFRPAEGGESRA